MTKHPDSPPDESENSDATPADETTERAEKAAESPALPKEIGGRDGPEPTRFGDWEKNGRCIDF